MFYSSNTIHTTHKTKTRLNTLFVHILPQMFYKCFTKHKKCVFLCRLKLYTMTINYVIDPRPKQSGEKVVRIRLTHQRKTKYITTSVSLNPSQINKDGETIKDKRIAIAIEKKVLELRQRAAEIPDLELYTVEELYDILTEKPKEAFRLDFFAYARERAKARTKNTADGWNCALKAFARYLGKDCIDINAITSQVILGFRAYLEEEEGKKGCRSVSKYLTDLRTVHNMAKREYNDEDADEIMIPRNPFPKGSIPAQGETEHRVLELEQLQYFLSLEEKNHRQNVWQSHYNLAVSVAQLSFYLVGMNSADLYELKKTDLKDGILTYERAKTKTVRTDKARI